MPPPQRHSDSRYVQRHSQRVEPAKGMKMEKAFPSTAYLLLRPARPKPPSDSEATSERLSAVLVLPEQFSSLPHNTYKTRGEVALMYAVLDDAVRCFQRQTVANGRRAQRLAREAEDWFFTDDYDLPFSFVNICAVLGLDPEYLRLGLKRWCQRHRAGPQKQRRRVGLVRQPLKISA